MPHDFSDYLCVDELYSKQDVHYKYLYSNSLIPIPTMLFAFLIALPAARGLVIWPLPWAVRSTGL